MFKSMRNFILVLVLIIMLLIVALPIGAQSDDEQSVGNYAVTILILAPKVDFKRTNTGEWLQIRENGIVGTGDTIRTGTNGRARLVFFEDGSRIDLEPNTVLQIDELQSDDDNFVFRLTLIQGQTRHRILRQFSARSVYEVQTANGTLALSTGEFDIRQTDDNAFELLVLSGTMTVRSDEDEIGTIGEGLGSRLNPNGTLADRVSTTSFDGLDTLLDGCEGVVVPSQNKRLPVYISPDANSVPLGVVNPYEINVILGSTADRSWFRIPYDGGAGWLPDTNIDRVETIGCPAFRVLPNDVVEDPEAYKNLPDTLSWEYCAGLRLPPSNWSRYAIRRGFTLYELAQRTGSTVEQITQINCIANPTGMVAGERIYLPPVP